MSDLTSELRQVADAAGHQARPLPAADIIRRGDRRRRRSVAQRSLGGLSAVGAASLAGVMIFTGGPVTSQAASGSGHPPGFTAVTDSVTSAGGTMTVHVDYQVERHGKVKVLAVTCSGHSKASLRQAILVFEIETPPNGKTETGFVGLGHLKVSRNGDFSGSLPVRVITKSAKKHHGLILPNNSTMQVGFGHAATAAKGITSLSAAHASMRLGMIFTA